MAQRKRCRISAFRLRLLLSAYVLQMILILRSWWKQHNVDENTTKAFKSPTSSSSCDIPLTSTTPFHELSMCVLIQDDNHLLPEWIAYHYFALNVTYLVVAVDPYSKTSPSHIFQRWRGRMNIVEWTDANFTDDTRLQRPTIINSSFAQLNRLYVKRQNLFFTQCLKHMKEHHRSWTVFIDTDEYLTMNQHVVPNAQTRLGAGHGSIAQILNQLQDDQLRRQHQLPFVGMHHLRKSCLTFWRRRYNALESNHHDNDDDNNNNNNHTATMSLVQQSGMDVNQFLTLRFLRLALEPNQSEGAVKSMIDASVIPDCLLRWNTYHGSPHRPIARICPNIAKGYDKFPLGIHHYVGSLESYLYRDDSRVAKVRNPTKWRQDALRDTGHVDDEITTWLHGFVNWVGFHEARRLLDGAGVLDYSWKERNMEYAKVFFPHNITAA